MAQGGPLVFLLVTEMGRNVEFYKIMLRYKHLFGVRRKNIQVLNRSLYKF